MDTAVKAGDDAPKSTTARSAALLLGLDAWLTCALWPALVSTDAPGWLRLVWTMLPPVSLGVGIVLVTRRAPTWAAAALVLVYPLTLAAALAFGPRASLERLGGAVWLALAAFASLAFGAAAVLATRPELPVLEAAVQPLSDEPWDASTANARGLSRWLSAVLTGGAGALVVVAATWGGTPALERAWGAAAPEGALLTAVVASALAVATVASFLGNALRAPARLEAPPVDRPLRVASLLLLALLGAMVYAVVR